MEKDPEYGEAVLRTCMHRNTPQDGDLNSHILKDAFNPGGIDLTDPQYQDLLVIAETNKTRIALNTLQAQARTAGQFAPQLHICAACHIIASQEVAKEVQNICIGVFDCELLPELPLYVGAPVILKVSIFAP